MPVELLPARRLQFVSVTEKNLRQGYKCENLSFKIIVFFIQKSWSKDKLIHDTFIEHNLFKNKLISKPLIQFLKV